MRAAGESKTAVGATALKATTVEAEVSAAQVAVLEVTMEAKLLELAVGAIVYVVEAVRVHLPLFADGGICELVLFLRPLLNL